MCGERCEWGTMKWPFPLPGQLLWMFFSPFLWWVAASGLHAHKLGVCVFRMFLLAFYSEPTDRLLQNEIVHRCMDWKQKKSNLMLSYFSKITWVLHLFRSLKINLCEEKVIWVVMTQLLWFMGVSSVLVLTRKWSWVTADMWSVIPTQCCVCTIFWVQINTEKNQSFNGLKNHWGFTMNSSISCSLYCMYLN